MSITATEFKKRMSYYMKLSEKQYIYITQYGQLVTKLTNPFKTKRDILNSLIGVIPESSSLEDAKNERAEKL